MILAFCITLGTIGCKQKEQDKTKYRIAVIPKGTTHIFRQSIHRGSIDTGALCIKALRKGDIDSLVVQNPYKMGYEGVKILVKKLQDKETPKRIDTGVRLITRDNINTPEIQALLK